MTNERLQILFSNELEAKYYWKDMREQQGICCKHCNSMKLRWHCGHNSWICRQCNRSFTLRSGTVMQDSNLPYRIWLKAMFLMISTKKSISALEMQRQLGLKRYEPVLYMINKLRMAMGERDNKYELEGEVELDDAFVTVVKSGVEKKSPSVRGRGSLRKRSILVMVSRKTFKTKAGRKAYAPGFIKLMAMDNLDESSVLESVFASTNTSKTTIRSDAYRSFNKLKKLVRSHKPKVTPPKQAHIHLPWVHCAIGNLKRILNGIHHHINDENLQLYLNEFAYKFNRRKLSFTFDNILRAGLQMTWE